MCKEKKKNSKNSRQKNSKRDVAVAQETINFAVNKGLGKKPSIHSSNWQK